MKMADTRTYAYSSVIRGHHVYKSIWTPVIGETLHVRIEENNEYDRFAVSVLREDEIVGHIPQEISRLFSSFLNRGGAVTAEVTGKRIHGKGLEVPCLYNLTGNKKLVRKLRAKLS